MLWPPGRHNWLLVLLGDRLGDAAGPPDRLPLLPARALCTRHNHTEVQVSGASIRTGLNRLWQGGPAYRQLDAQRAARTRRRRVTLISQPLAAFLCFCRSPSVLPALPRCSQRPPRRSPAAGYDGGAPAWQGANRVPGHRCLRGSRGPRCGASAPGAPRWRPRRARATAAAHRSPVTARTLLILTPLSHCLHSLPCR
jgi:hypothetical protein